MCVIYIAVGQHSNYPLILLANRDEYYDRPTRAAGRWDEDPHIYAGRDLVGGGTWLGVSDGGRIAAVTNYRDPTAPAGTVSRGRLVAGYLRSDSEPDLYIDTVASRAADYSGFNLVVGEITTNSRELFYYSNRANDASRLSDGLYGLSNHLLDSPWPKVLKGKDRFATLLSAGLIDNDSLFAVLADEALAEDGELPSTGIPYEAEKALSAIMIKTPNYGTRCSTIVKFDAEGKWDFEERTFV